MQEKVNLKNNKCNFKECQNYEDGECLNEQDREYCLEIARAVLCIDKEEDHD